MNVGTGAGEAGHNKTHLDMPNKKEQIAARWLLAGLDSCQMSDQQAFREGGLTWTQVRKGGCSGPGNRKQPYCQPANIRNLLDLAGLYPFPFPALSKDIAKGLNYLISSV